MKRILPSLLAFFLIANTAAYAQSQRIVNAPTWTTGTINNWVIDNDPKVVPYDFSTGGQLVYVVNPGAGFQFNTGTVTASTLRVTLATDGPGITQLNTIAANSLKIPTTTTETHMSVSTAATGTNYTAFGSQACLLLDVVNTSGTDIEVTRGGTGVAIRLPNNSARMFGAITNASQLSVRRVDTSNTQVAVTAVAITP
jgi:hypothetical protein